MIITNDSYKLLTKMFDIETEKFKTKDITMSMLSKESKILECMENVLLFMQTRDNSTFFVKNTENDNSSSMGLIISNVIKKNDHQKYFYITIASSCETFQIEEVLSDFIQNVRIIKNYDESRL